MIRKTSRILFVFTFLYGLNASSQIWEKVFSDEFNGTSVNEDDWYINQNGQFKKSALVVSDGTLKINNSFPSAGNDTGGWIETKNGFAGDDKYGYYEARIRITSNPNGKIWPTWWIWGKNWRKINGVVNTDTATEFDLMEYSGWAKKYSGNNATSSHHFQRKRVINGKSKTTTTNEDAANRNAFEWHIWGMYWTPTEVSFYYDGEKYLESDEPEDAATEIYPMKLIFSCSPHMNNPTPELEPKVGDILPTFEIDWVRVWRGSISGPEGCQGLPGAICQDTYVSNDNFSTLVISESCVDGNNGKISIEAKEEYSYTAKIEGTSMSKSFTKDVSFEDLSPGEYSVCITFSENSSYSQCFDVLVKEAP